MLCQCFLDPLAIDFENTTYSFFFRILKLLNQRMLENLKEKWWAQNPNKATCEDDDSDTSGGIIVLMTIS